MPDHPAIGNLSDRKAGHCEYTSPKGMTKTLKQNVVAFSELNTSGKYCIITLYGATPGTGTPTGDFKREWNNLVVKTMKTAEANPTTETTAADGWTATGGGSEVESEAGKAVGFLTVISGFGKTVSVLAIFNDQAYVKQVDSFISTRELHAHFQMGSKEMKVLSAFFRRQVSSTTQRLFSTQIGRIGRIAADS